MTLRRVSLWLGIREHNVMKVSAKIGWFVATLALVILLLPALTLAQAQNIYLAQNATGSANGADCNNTYSYTFFNASSNWGRGAAQIGPGTTVHICGTITGAANATLLTFQGSGSSGNPVTLLFESGANLTSPYWGGPLPTGAINISNQSYIVINGGTNGIIQNTQNGTGLTYEQPSNMIALIGVSNIIIENLTISNVCQLTSTSDLTACNSGGFGSSAISIHGGSNVVIKHNTIHDAQTILFYSPSGNGESGDIFEYNTTYRQVDMMVEGSCASSPCTTPGFSIIGNESYCVIGSTCNWAITSGNLHAEILHIFLSSGTTYSGATIANNYFHDLGAASVTGGLNLEPGGGVITNFLIFNNVIDMSRSGNYCSSNGSGGNSFYNNTCVGGGIGFANPPATIENNIWPSGGFIGFSSLLTGSVINYNDYFGSGGWNTGSRNYASLSTWQSGSTGVCSGGCDANTITTSPNLTSAYVPNSGSPVIGAGTNLTSLGITLLDSGAPQTFGVNYACGTGCVPRPATGPWDMGAYQSGSGSASQPTPPTGVTATVE